MQAVKKQRLSRTEQINRFKTLCQEHVFENRDLQVGSQPPQPNHFILEDSTTKTVIGIFKDISEMPMLHFILLVF